MNDMELTHEQIVAIACAVWWVIGWGCGLFANRRREPVLVPTTAPIAMYLTCPKCNTRHIDRNEFATTKVHHTHSCQSCGLTWRPAVEKTVGVEFLPGFKDADAVPPPCDTKPCSVPQVERARRDLSKAEKAVWTALDAFVDEECAAIEHPDAKRDPVACEKAQTNLIRLHLDWLVVKMRVERLEREAAVEGVELST